MAKGSTCLDEQRSSIQRKSQQNHLNPPEHRHEGAFLLNRRVRSVQHHKASWPKTGGAGGGPCCPTEAKIQREVNRDCCARIMHESDFPLLLKIQEYRRNDPSARS